MGTSALYLHRQPWRVHTIVFHANQQVQLLSEVNDFATVDSGRGGNTNWVRDCSEFHILFRFRMACTTDLCRISCTLVGKPHRELAIGYVRWHDSELYSPLCSTRIHFHPSLRPHECRIVVHIEFGSCKRQGCRSDRCGV